MHHPAGSQQALRHNSGNASSCRISCAAFTRGPPHARKAYFLGSCTGALSPSSIRVASAKQTFKTHVAVQQRPGALGDVPQHGEPHSHLEAVSRSTDDSLKIIMLLSLSLTLMLLPWMSRHPEFLIAPLLLAVTPVVGNGVRPVLKEAGASILTALRLSFGALIHGEHHQQLPGHHHHHNRHHGHHDSQYQHHNHHSHTIHHHNQHQQQHSAARSHIQHQQQQQPIPQGPYSRLPRQQQQHPTPAGPYSPWPNPAQTPVAWPSARAAAAATTRSSDEIDADWGLRASPDPHHSDPHSQQHLQQVLAADDQVEQELEQGLAAAAAAAAVSHASLGSMSRSPSGSPSSSMDAGHAAEHVAAGGSGSDYRSHLHHHVRDPRVLSKEAKQQLYHSHQHQQQQQQQ